MSKNAKELAIKYLSYKARTEKEVRDYLKKKENADNDVEETINLLKTAGFINDIQYVFDYISYALLKRYGEFRIKIELKKRGVSEFDIEDGIYEFEQIENVDLKELQIKNAILEKEKIFSKIKDFDDREAVQKSKEKLMRRLSYLGYDGSIISKVLKG